MILSLIIFLSLYVQIFSRSDLELQYAVHLFTEILVCSRVMACIRRPETPVLSTYIGTTVNRRLYSACFWPVTKI